MGHQVETKRGRKTPPRNKITPWEKKKIIDELLRPDWIDLSPREIYYKLLDEKGKILASPASFYRIAKNNSLLTKRVKTNSDSKLNRETPHLSAIGINQVWSWDVTQIRSSIRLERYYLYIIMDIWSRFVVGWALEDHEKTEYAIEMWKDALERQNITGSSLVNHKDNGGIMTSKEMVKFVKDAKMVDSYSRAGVSDDNPFSEAIIRTLKYFRDFPGFFDSLNEGRIYFVKYFKDYNFTHRHSGIQFLTPAQRHYGKEKKILAKRNRLINSFYEGNRHRYPGKPKKFKPIFEVKIN